MQYTFSQVERENLILQHKKERDKRICDRIKAVLLRDEGWNYEQIAHVLLLTDEAVRQHISDYQKSQKLKPENGGSCSKLNDDQTMALLKHLEKQTYLYAKDIVAYVKTTFEVEYSIPGMTNWLQTHEFSYKKPAVVPGKANRLAQEQWILEYEALKAQLPKNETICFIDGVHPTHNTKTAYGWIRRGERKEILTNTGRQRLNLSGAIDISTRKVFIREDETLNADSTIAFLKMLEAGYPDREKVHVFCDNARYYKNKDVMAYLSGSKVHMHFLPPYSPNLNPIERLWKFMNEHVLYNRYYEKFNDFKKEVLGFLQRLKGTEDDPLLNALKKRITDRFRVMGTSAC
ncbi:MAG: IS630 family transposase [Flavitalea sp.]